MAKIPERMPTIPSRPELSKAQNIAQPLDAAVPLLDELESYSDEITDNLFKLEQRLQGIRDYLIGEPPSSADKDQEEGDHQAGVLHLVRSQQRYSQLALGRIDHLVDTLQAHLGSTRC